MKRQTVFTLGMSFIFGFNLVFNTQMSRICDCSKSSNPALEILKNMLPYIIFAVVFLIYDLIQHKKKQLTTYLVITFFTLQVISIFLLSIFTDTLAKLVVSALILFVLFIFFTSKFTANFINRQFGDGTTNELKFASLGFMVSFLLFVSATDNEKNFRNLIKSIPFFECTHQTCEGVKTDCVK